MRNNTFDTTLDQTLTEEERERVDILLRQVSNGLDAAQRSSWKAALVARFEHLCARYKRMTEDISSGQVHWSDLIKEIHAALADADSNFKQIFGGRELLADAALLQSITELFLAKLMSSLDADKTTKHFISATTFAAKLMQCNGRLASPVGNEHDELSAEELLLRWIHLAMLDFKPYPVPFCIPPGIQNLEEVQVKQPLRRRREHSGNVMKVLLKPAELQDDGSEAMSQILDKMLICLRDELERLGTDHMGYYEYVLHPTDYAKTVENMFHVSFLLKEKRVRLWVPDGSLPQLAMVDRTANGNVTNDDKTHNTCVISITPHDWTELVKLLGIKEPVVHLD